MSNLPNCEGAPYALDWMSGERAQCGSSRSHDPHEYEVDGCGVICERCGEPLCANPDYDYVGDEILCQRCWEAEQ